jgi:glycosyltransferase involved in cell wall biosynthesis
MRVLMLHNRYRAEGGEERAVADIAALLSTRGHSVEVLERTSAGVARTRAAAGMLLGGMEPEVVGEAVRSIGADVVHAHNVHPLFGWRALAAAREAGARTVLHLHNFRLFCAIAVAYRDGGSCFRCRGSTTLPGLRLRCRGSAVESAVYAAGIHRQQPRLYEHADRFIALSDAQRSHLHAAGLPVERTDTLANFVFAERIADATHADGGDYALAVGRLVEEKGFDTAIDAARRAAMPLVLAGVGPDEARLRALAVGSETHFAGWLDADALAELRAGAAAVLVPSRAEESTCPYVALDALAAGVPVLASDHGGMREHLPPEARLPPADVGAWASVLRELWRDPAARRHRGEEAIGLARTRFGEDAYYAALLRIYAGG